MLRYINPVNNYLFTSNKPKIRESATQPQPLHLKITGRGEVIIH